MKEIADRLLYLIAHAPPCPGWFAPEVLPPPTFEPNPVPVGVPPIAWDRDGRIVWENVPPELRDALREWDVRRQADEAAVDVYNARRRQEQFWQWPIYWAKEMLKRMEVD